MIVAVIMQIKPADAKILAITMGIMALANILVVRRKLFVKTSRVK
jgi:hypothetical protein